MGPGPAERDYPGDDHPEGDHPASTGGEPEHRSAPTPVGKPETVLEAQARRRAEVAADLPAEEEHRAEEEQRADEEHRAGTAGSGRVESWRRRSAVGALLTGIALGLGEVLEAERKEPAIVQETSGVPPRDLPVEADLGEASPKRSIVHVRPWLLGDPGALPGSPAVPGSEASDPPTHLRVDTEPASDPPPAGVDPDPARYKTPTAATPVPARAPVRRRLGRRH